MTARFYPAAKFHETLWEKGQSKHFQRSFNIGQDTVFGKEFSVLPGQDKHRLRFPKVVVYDKLPTLELESDFNRYAGLSLSDTLCLEDLSFMPAFSLDYEIFQDFAPQGKPPVLRRFHTELLQRLDKAGFYGDISGDGWVWRYSCHRTPARYRCKKA